jgi:serine/threonine protein kinase
MVGRIVAQYKFVEKLGAGGMGEIYKAQDTRLNRFVAIKVLPAAKSGDPERRQRFLQEAQAASGLNHPNIITIHDVLSEGDTEFMVMEYVAGKTLNDIIPRGGLRVPQALKYALQMSDALSVAHIAGITHRDLKPANVMVTDSGLVKVLDFGLAKLTDPTPTGPIGEDDETVAAKTPLTVEGSIMGTVAYMSPEQAQGKKVDPRSDIFSFGAVLYEMVTGRRAFDGDSTIATLSAILRDDPKPMSEVAPDVPQQLADVIDRCLRKEVDDRFQTMREVQGALSVLKRESDSGSLYSTRSSGAMATTVIMPNAPGPKSATGTQPPVSKEAAANPATAVPPTATIPPVAAKKSSNSILIVGAIIVVLAGAGGLYWRQQKQAAERTAAAVAAQAAADAAAQAQAQAEMQKALDDAAKQAAEETLTNNNVLDLVTNKVPVQVILEHIRSAKETKFDMSTPELIRLSKAGVPPVLIDQMRNPKRTPPRLDVVATNTKQLAPAAPAQPTGVKPSTPAPVPTPVPIATGDSHVLPVTPAPAAATPTPAPAAAPAAEIVAVAIPDGVPFKMVLADDIPSDADLGLALKFVATDDFRAQGSVVVRKGSVVYGEISETAKKKKIFGIGNGKLSFILTKADGAGGQPIKVRAMAARRNDGATQRPVDTGKSGTKTLAAAKGTEYVAYIDGAQTVNVPK